MITKKSDDQIFFNIAVSYVNKTIVNHYCPHYSCSHIVHDAITYVPKKSRDTKDIPMSLHEVAARLGVFTVTPYPVRSKRDLTFHRHGIKLNI